MIFYLLTPRKLCTARTCKEWPLAYPTEHKTFATMKTTTIVALTTQTTNELKVNDKVRGTLHRQGRRTYGFIENQRNAFPEEQCQADELRLGGQAHRRYGIAAQIAHHHGVDHAGQRDKKAFHHRGPCRGKCAPEHQRAVRGTGRI